jgi:hypothetical protein
MKYIRKVFSIILLVCFGVVIVQAQETIPATGGIATGSGGSVTFTVGQVTYRTWTGTDATVAQGVQQPYEISVVTAIENTAEINLQCLIYPNPTRGLIKLIVESCENQNLRYQLYDSNGVLLRNKKVEAGETEIFMGRLSSAVYFLKVINDNMELKVFKIIKR